MFDWLQEQAEIADTLRDHEAAKAWRDIADAAKLILSSRSRPE